MKKVFTIALMALTMVFTSEAIAQDFGGLDKSPMDAASYPTDYKVSNKAIRIVYGRPALKGRNAMDLMTKDGPVWRTGANEAPEITFYQDVNFGGKDIKAGTYALLTIPGEKEWTVILHDGLNQWGSYFYKEGNDVARVTIDATQVDEPLEEFSIAFKKVDSGAHMVMGWDTIRVAVPITM